MTKKTQRNKVPPSAPAPAADHTRQQTLEERTADLQLRAAKARAEDAANIARAFDVPKKSR